MNSLDEIAIKYKTDKSSMFHGYCDKYEKFLPFDREANLNILEIGVSRAASLRMWGDFYPNSLVYGIEIKPNAWLMSNTLDRITVLKGNQSDIGFLKDVCETHGPFDLIIDDGSHNTRHQFVTFDYMIDQLKKDGVYIIEDLSTSYWDEFKEDGFSMVDYLKDLVDDLNYYGAKHEGSFSRKEALLDQVYKRKYNFLSLLFINSACFIFK